MECHRLFVKLEYHEHDSIQYDFWLRFEYIDDISTVDFRTQFDYLQTAWLWNFGADSDSMNSNNLFND